MTKRINCFLALLLGASSALAEGELEQMSVIAERLPSENSSAWSVSALADDDLQTFSIEHIQQALNSLPGVNLQRGNGMEYLPALRSPVLTGAGACGNLLVMEEGIRLRSAGSCNINELFDVHTEHASQIEVLRGPTSAFHGANALLGALDVSLGVRSGSAISLDANQLGYKRAKLHSGYTGDKERGSVYFTVTEDSGWRDDSGLAQQKLSWRHESDSGRWNLRPGATLVNLNQETAGFVVGEDAFEDSTLAEGNDNPEAFRDSQAARVWLHARLQASDNLQWLITPYARHTDMDFLQHFLPGDPLETNSQTGVGVQTSIHQQLTRQWQLNYGVDVEAAAAELTQSQDDPTQGSAFLVATIPVGGHYDYDVDSTLVAAFVQANGQLSSALSLSLGLRAESVHYDYTNHLPVGRTRDDGTECGFGGCRYSRPADSDDRFTELSPNIAISYQSGGWRLFSAVGLSYRPPQTSELYRLQREQSIAELDSVQARTLNIGVEKTWVSGLLKAEAYYQEQDNLIIRDVNFFNVDNANAIYSGLEFTWRQRWQSLTSYLIINWADHRYGDNQLLGADTDGNPIDVSGNEVDTAPAWFGRWQLRWAVNDDWLTELELDYMGDYFLEPQNEHEYSGHTVVNWRTQWAVHKRTQLRLSVNNLFDENYATRADYTGFSGYRYFPGEPRAFMLGVSHSF